MESIEKIYTALKKFDTDGNLTLTDEYEYINGKTINNVIELKTADNVAVIAFADLIRKKGSADDFLEDFYVATILNGEEYGHFHSNDCDELFGYIFNVMKNGDTVLTREEIERIESIEKSDSAADWWAIGMLAFFLVMMALDLVFGIIEFPAPVAMKILSAITLIVLLIILVNKKKNKFRK